MEKKEFNELLAITEADILKLREVKKIIVYYRQTFWKRLFASVFPKVRELAEFNLNNWVIFKEDIIDNLYNKKLCQIKFIKLKETKH